MSQILVKDKAIVVPGEALAEGMDFFPSFGTYRDQEKIYASRLGLVNLDGKVLKIVPLSGRYLPKINDTIIGKVEDVSYSGWRINLNGAYSAMLNSKDGVQEFLERGADLSRFYDIGDYVVTKIINVTSQKMLDLTMKGPGLRKITGGRIIEVNTHKVPRIIGKAGSMVSMIKQSTGCRIIVGQNGWVWIDGEPMSEKIAVDAIRKIEKEAHLAGLTDKMKIYLEKATGKKIEAAPMQDNRSEQSFEDRNNNNE